MAASPTRFAELPGERELSGKLIVRPRQRVALQAGGRSIQEALDAHSQARRELQRYEVVRYIPATDESLVRVPSGWNEERLARRLLATGLFEYAEPDWILFPLGVSPQDKAAAPPHGATQFVPSPNCPNDPLLDGQYHHDEEHLGSCKAWELGTGTPQISIGVCDTGLRTTHEDLQLHRLEGYNAVDHLWESEGGAISPAHYHGTRTTGTVAANGNNGIGISGVGWNLSHRMLRVSNQSDGGAQLSDLQHAARTSIESGDRLANLSYHGAYLSSNPATAAYIKALGGLMVWGAGNTGSNHSHADRDSDDLIVVGATTQSDTLWTSSSYGTFIDLVAPGVGILTSDSGSDSDYVVTEGTSYACPLAVGVCAMIWDRQPTLSPSDVERILKENAQDLGVPGLDDFFGYGRVRLLESMQDPGTAVPLAAIGAYPESGALPLEVSFRDLSTGVPTSWLWDFGDGSSSTLQNPIHTYSTLGAYSVTLTAANELGQDQTTNTDFILVDIVPPVADFTADPVAGLAPLTVDFTDQSSGGTPTTWLWDFGDGSTSTEVHPSHTYTAAGFYTVSLTLTNDYGTDQRVQSDLVAVDFIPPVAAFSGTPTSGASPLAVQFTDESVGGVATSWSWIFGDGTGSVAQNPSHTYTAAGTYSVRLQATNAYGVGELWKTAYIEVGAGPALLADFVGTPTTGTAPLTVTFTDLSLGNIVAWEWNFGDDVNSNLQNPTHTYTAPGEYDVALQVCNADGADDQLELKKYVVVQ